MATYKHLRSSTANKRPTTTIVDGQLAINTNTDSPGLFFKDSAGTGIVKVGPVHVGTTAPNSVPASGGSTGNYTGEQWLDTSVSPAQMKVWNGSTWVGIVADELPVSKLQDGAARQLIQTDAAGTGVEWTSNVDVPGTLDVTSTATFDSIAQHPLGTAGAPTITFTGDTNTGIYSPGADQVAISTNGTGRLFVDASGNVGLGVSPSARLEVNGESRFTRSGVSTQYVGIAADGTDTRIVAEGSAKNLTIKNNSTTSSVILFDQAVASSYVFNQAGNERMRLDSGGRLGLGTSSPVGLLDVRGEIKAGPINSIHGTTLLSDTYTVGGASLGSLCIERSTGALVLTTNVKQAENATGYISTNTVDFGKSALKLGSTGLFYATASASVVPIGDSVSLTDRFVITTAGNVGIGTTTPGYPLHILGSTPNLAIQDSGANRTRALIEATNSAVYYGSTYNASNIPTIFSQAGASGGIERMRIDSSGRLLVGTSSQSGGSLLQVNDNRIRIATAKTPASATDTGVAGEICWDANYVYVCTATNTWKRTAISTW